jgi:hypothetical protein
MKQFPSTTLYTYAFVATSFQSHAQLLLLIIIIIIDIVIACSARPSLAVVKHLGRWTELNNYF